MVFKDGLQPFHPDLHTAALPSKLGGLLIATVPLRVSSLPGLAAFPLTL